MRARVVGKYSGSTGTPNSLFLTVMREGAYKEGILFRQRKYKDFYF